MKKMIEIGSLQGGLYKLFPSSIFIAPTQVNSSFSVNNVVSSQFSAFDLWHARMGHAPADALQALPFSN